MDRDERPYRRCAGAMLLNAEGLVFVGRRLAVAKTDGDFGWQMPQGGIDDGEEPAAASRRELHEETNVTSADLLAEAPDWYSYDLPAEVTGGRWNKYRGQTQKWFAFRFTGDETEIDIAHPASGAHKPEFAEWRWVAMEELPGLIIPFKRSVYESVVAAFRHLAP